MPIPFIDPLERVSTARSLLDQAKTVDEIARLIKEEREQWTRYRSEISDSRAIKLLAAEIEFRAQVRCGEMLLDFGEDKGGKDDSQPRLGIAVEKRAAKKTFGLDKDQARKAEQVARLGPEKIDAYVEQKREQGKPVTVGEILRVAGMTVEEAAATREKTPVEKAYDRFRTVTGAIRMENVDEFIDLMTQDWEKNDGAVERGNIVYWRNVAATLNAVADGAEQRMGQKLRVVKGTVSA